jgi:hypothetical protein
VFVGAAGTVLDLKDAIQTCMHAVASRACAEATANGLASLIAGVSAHALDNAPKEVRDGYKAIRATYHVVEECLTWL